jgi:DNA-binding transcriptional ArsR family regulator
MVDLMGPERNLHDLSSARSRRVRISVDHSPLYDLLLVMWSVFGADDKADSHSVGKDWFDEFRKHLSPETLEAATRASGFGELWVALLPIVETAPDRSIDAALSWLEASDPVWLREALLAEKFCEVSPDIRAAAARGEDDGVAAVLAEASTMKMDETFCKSLETFLEIPADEVIPPLVEAIRRVRSEAFAEYEEEWAAAQARDAAARQPLIDSATSTKDLIESITNGIAYDLPQGVRRVVFIPSVSLRPWTLITDHDDALLVCYPVADEHLVLDPEAPPSALLAVYKALGDDKRMRLLRKLSEGPATLAELTEHLGMAKSTVFHHMAVLRAAGLVRVLFADGQVSTYGLRLDSIPGHATLLDQYLNPNPAQTGTKAQGATS